MIQKKTYEYIYFFILVLYAGLGCSFTNAIRNVPHSNAGWLGLFIFTALTIILVVRKNIGFRSNNLYIAIGVFSFWSIIQVILYSDSLEFGHYFFIIYNILLSYIIIITYKEKLWFYYCDCVYKLCIICLFLWLASLLFPSQISSLMLFKNESHLLEGNSIIFSMTNRYVEADNYWYRNSGFSWEPGRFACFIILALYILLYNAKENILKNRRFWVLLFSLLSTFSTTGYFSFIILITLRYVVLKKKYLKLVLFIPAFFIVWQLDFMKTKIEKHINIRNRIEALITYYDDINSSGMREGNVTPQRFEGLYFDYLNFKANPILGYGRNRVNSYCQQNISSQLTTSNGLIGCFARFGIIFGVIIFICLYRTSFLLSELFRYKNKWTFFLIFILISISYDFIEVPLFMSFWMYSVFINKNICNGKGENWNYNSCIQSERYYKKRVGYIM